MVHGFGAGAPANRTRREIANPLVRIVQCGQEKRQSAGALNLCQGLSCRSADLGSTVLKRTGEYGKDSVIFEIRDVLQRGAPYALVAVTTPVEKQLSALTIPKISGDLHRGFTHIRIRIT